MTSGSSWMKKGLVLGAGTLCLALTVSTAAQVQTNTTAAVGQSSQIVQVTRGEVVAVEGNDLIVKMEDGSIRHFPNIPASTRITVDGKQLGVHDLKPGMKLQRTITTTTTPQTVTTVETVTGTVWNVVPPLSVVLTLENGTNQSFKIPKDQKFNVNGQMVDAFALRKGMRISATKIVEVPLSVTKQQKIVSGTMPTAPPPDTPLLIAEGEPTSAPQATETPTTPAKTVPTPGGYVLVIGLIVVLLIIVGFVAKNIRAKSRT